MRFAAAALLIGSPAGVRAETVRVLRSPQVSIAYPESSQELAQPEAAGTPVVTEHPILGNPFLKPQRFQPDPVAQTLTPVPSMPATILNLLGQGRSLSSATVTGTPPDANGAVGPNHYVQVVNGGFAVWNKSGSLVKASTLLSHLWTGYVGHPGNGCAVNNDGDPVVIYDQLADRWFISQFSLPNLSSSPNYECVAVSKTGDPTGAYWLYDFQYNGVNDYMKFGVWPDAYYATSNLYLNSTYVGDVACAYDRNSMLNGLPATQQCFTLSKPVFGLLPATVDGSVMPPRGEPGFFVELGEDSNFNFNNTLQLWKLQVDWANPTNTTFTGPLVLTVAAYTWPCQAGPCIQELGGPSLDAMGDRLMFRLAYRNFGTHESLVVNHTVVAGSTTGVRWYEIRSPNGTPAVFQQGTYAPNDGKWRWMGSLAQDQAEDFALGYSTSSSAAHPAMVWTGRTVNDTAGIMGQAEAVVRSGLASEASSGRWGDYASMTVDPSDDCTFWFTSEYYDVGGSTTWDTRIATVRLPNCAANNFSLGVSPSTGSVAAGSQTTYTVSSTLTAGTAESITLNVQDLPTGVAGSFNPAVITAGTSSTLTLTAASSAPVTAAPVTFTVIAKTASAVHPAAGSVSVTPLVPTAPTNVVATAVAPMQVNITWNAVAGATSYQVFRRAAGTAFLSVGTPTTNSFSDTSVAANSAYLYKVQTVIGAVNSSDSNIDLATTVIFTDDPLVAGTTVVNAVHLTELRTAISAVAALAATGPVTFTDDPAVAGTTPVKSIHVTELRSDLNTALAALSLPTLTFTYSAAPNTPIAATDFTELRNGVK